MLGAPHSRHIHQLLLLFRMTDFNRLQQCRTAGALVGYVQISHRFRQYDCAHQAAGAGLTAGSICMKAMNQ